MKILHYFGYALIRLFGRLPYRLLYFIGCLLGPIYWHLSKRDRHVTQANINACFPQLSDAEKLHISKSSMTHTVINALEGTWAWQHQYAVTGKKIRHVYGLERVAAAESADTGTLYLLGHFGNWEIFGSVGCHYANNMVGLGREFGIPLLDEHIRKGRQHSGVEMFPCTKAGLQALYAATAKGHSTALLTDQQPSLKHGVFSPFFGINALTSLLTQDMLQKTGAKVILTGLVRLPKGRGFDLHFLEADPDIYSAELSIATAAHNRSYEKLIALAPEQYTWNYKRFSKRPDGESRIY